MVRILVYTNDLFWKVRMQAVAKQVGNNSLFFVQSSEQCIQGLLQAETKRLFVDLAMGANTLGIIREAKRRAPTTEVIAYVEHVQRELIAQAREAGADKVFARSALSEELSILLL